jgi:mannose-6-phosphate isomerase-like protein (cupin superfamily)
MQKKLKTKDIPNRKKVLKPWGSEYKIYSNSILSIKLLRIHKNQSTSLHCHPVKKTGFILIKGTVEVDLGFYNKKNLSAPTKLMIRPGLFHATKNNINETSVILEIETPIDKDDLVRFKDSYGRENQSYEGKKYCPSSKVQPYGKDSCYFVKSNQQGVSGIICNEDTSIYEGTWKDHKMEGYGKYIWPSFDDERTSLTGEYEGNWQQGQMNGYGKRSWADGDYYEGIINKNFNIYTYNII